MYIYIYIDFEKELMLFLLKKLLYKLNSCGISN